MQKGKTVVWGGLTNSWEKKRNKRQRKKGKIYPSEWDKALSHSTPILTPMATHSNTGSSMETGKFHGWRSLVGYSSWGCKESDTTERLHFLSFYSSFWRRRWQPTPVFLPGESHGQRGLMGYSLWGCKELDTTKQLHTHTHTSIWMQSSKEEQGKIRKPSSVINAK